MEQAKKYLPYLTMILAALTIVFLALPCYKVDMNYGLAGVEVSANGFALIFGGKAKGEVWSDGEYESLGGKAFELSVGNLFAFICIILAIVVFAAAMKENNLILTGFSGVLFIVAAILFFCMLENCKFYEAGGFDDLLRDVAELGIGAILAGVASILAGITAFAQALIISKDQKSGQTTDQTTNPTI